MESKLFPCELCSTSFATDAGRRKHYVYEHRKKKTKAGLMDLSESEMQRLVDKKKEQQLLRKRHADAPLDGAMTRGAASDVGKQGEESGKEKSSEINCKFQLPTLPIPLLAQSPLSARFSSSTE